MVNFNMDIKRGYYTLLEGNRMADRVYHRKNGKWEARYIKGKNATGKTVYGSVFADTREEAVAKRDEILGRDPNDIYSAARLNIIILGAGSYGREVKDELEKLRVYNEIAFLDDMRKAPDILGRCVDVAKFRYRYPCAFVAIGDNEIRKKYAKLLIDNGFYVPTIVSPNAIVSPKAKLGVGTMIFAQGNVGAATIGNFCLVQANGLVNAEAKAGDFSRIDNGAIVLKGEKTPEATWLKPGKIYGEV